MKRFSLGARLTAALALVLLAFGLLVAGLVHQVNQDRERESLQRLSHGLARHIVAHWPKVSDIDRARADRNEEADLREGRRPRRRHDEPLTPADRLLRWGGMGRMGRQRIEKLQQQCDPAALLGAIRHNQAALVNGAAVLVDRSGRLRMLSFALCNPCPTAPPLAPTRLQSTHPIPAARSWRSRLISSRPTAIVLSKT